MAWYNRWSDFTGDVNDIVHGRNPMNKPPPVPIPPGGPTGSTPGQVYPIGDHDTGGNIPQTTIPPVGVHAPDSGGSMAGDDEGGDKGLGDYAKDAGKWIWDNKEGIFKWVVAAGAANEAYKNTQQSNALMQEGLGMAREDYNSRLPYRDAAKQNLLDPRTPDLSGLFANSGNPYAAGRQIPVVGNRIPASATPGAGTDAHRIPTGTGSTTTVNYGGKQYTQAEWEAYKQANPNWDKPTTPGQQTQSGTRMVPTDPVRIPSVGRGR